MSCATCHEDLVIVEVMPEQYRESHRAAGNWGRYPHNGAVRLVAHRGDAECLVSDDDDGYTEIIGDATLEDERTLPLYDGSF